MYFYANLHPDSGGSTAPTLGDPDGESTIAIVDEQRG